MRPKRAVAVERELAIRLCIVLRNEIDYNTGCPSVSNKAPPNANADDEVTYCCSAGVLTGEISGDEDIAATAIVT